MAVVMWKHGEEALAKVRLSLHFLYIKGNMVPNGSVRYCTNAHVRNANDLTAYRH